MGGLKPRKVSFCSFLPPSRNVPTFAECAPTSPLPRCPLALTLTLAHADPTHPEKRLQALRKQQKDKIEEFKKKTKYYEARNLIERFDDGPGGGAPDSPTKRPPPGSIGPSPITTPQRSTGPNAARGPPQGLQPLQPVRGPMPAHLMRACRVS